MMSDLDFPTTTAPEAQPGPLAPYASAVASALRETSATVAAFETSTGGMINAALMAVPGSSAYATCGAVTYNRAKAAQLLGGEEDTTPRPVDAGAYIASKKRGTITLARKMRAELGTTWAIAEGGACGPTFSNLAGFKPGALGGPAPLRN
jgi:nicotinamide-nucleotide amidase